MRTKFVRFVDSEPVLWLKNTALKWGSTNCLKWPFGKNGDGYGKVRYKGEHAGAHNVVCRLAHGDPPFEGAEAAHYCGVRDCANPKHIRWATRTENQRDRKIQGTTRGRGPGRFSDDQIREIRQRCANGEQQLTLAHEFGCHKTYVSLIVLRKVRKSVT